MNVLCWHVQRIGNSWIISVLNSHINNHQYIYIFFISESKLNIIQAGEVVWRCNFDNNFAVDKIGMSGGLLLAWKNDLVVIIRSHSRYHIDAVISSDVFHFLHFTGFYGNPDTVQRVES